MVVVFLSIRYLAEISFGSVVSILSCQIGMFLWDGFGGPVAFQLIDPGTNRDGICKSNIRSS